MVSFSKNTKRTWRKSGTTSQKFWKAIKMNNIFNDMKSRGLISVERLPLFGQKLGVSENQAIYWKFFDGKFAKVTQMRLQHTILPCQLKTESRN